MASDVDQLMRRAIAEARRGMQRGNSPFGCAIGLDGHRLACAHNTVLECPDITAHAEVNALRQAGSKTGRLFLDGAVVATTCEPCPMCMAALHWARVDRVYFGATIADAASAGFNELRLPAAQLLEQGGSTVRLLEGPLADECRLLFQEWLQQEDHQAY